MSTSHVMRAVRKAARSSPLTPRVAGTSATVHPESSREINSEHSTVQGPCELILISSAPRVRFSRPHLITNPYITRSLIRERLALFPW